MRGKDGEKNVEKVNYVEKGKQLRLKAYRIQIMFVNDKT